MNMNLIKMFEQKSIGELINLVATAFNSLKDILYILQVDQSQFTYLYANQAGLSILNTDETTNRILYVICQPFEIKEHVLNITTSIGISFYPHNGIDIEELFKKADENLYKSKSLGGNTFSL